jgi:hypothetical protein
MIAGRGETERGLDANMEGKLTRRRTPFNAAGPTWSERRPFLVQSPPHPIQIPVLQRLRYVPAANLFGAC